MFSHHFRGDAAHHIDVLTGFRIKDYNALTPFQQSTLSAVYEGLTTFEEENADILDTPLTSYGINGVSMTFGERVKTINGVVIPADLYALLCSTGLCYPAI